jgi:tRNA(fMet)-specific endonuclease VapC
VPQVAAPAADAASEIRRSLERSGNPIGMADSLVAGIVTRNGGTLLTRNRRHFERVPGIRLA